MGRGLPGKWELLAALRTSPPLQRNPCSSLPYLTAPPSPPESTPHLVNGHRPQLGVRLPVLIQEQQQLLRGEGG